MKQLPRLLIKFPWSPDDPRVLAKAKTTKIIGYRDKKTGKWIEYERQVNVKDDNKETRSKKQDDAKQERSVNIDAPTLSNLTERLLSDRQAFVKDIQTLAKGDSEKAEAMVEKAISTFESDLDAIIDARAAQWAKKPKQAKAPKVKKQAAPKRKEGFGDEDKGGFADAVGGTSQQQSFKPDTEGTSFEDVQERQDEQRDAKQRSYEENVSALARALLDNAVDIPTLADNLLRVTNGNAEQAKKLARGIGVELRSEIGQGLLEQPSEQATEPEQPAQDPEPQSVQPSTKLSKPEQHRLAIQNASPVLDSPKGEIHRNASVREVFKNNPYARPFFEMALESLQPEPQVGDVTRTDSDALYFEISNPRTKEQATDIAADLARVVRAWDDEGDSDGQKEAASQVISHFIKNKSFKDKPLGKRQAKQLVKKMLAYARENKPEQPAQDPEPQSVESVDAALEQAESTSEQPAQDPEPALNENGKLDPPLGVTQDTVNEAIVVVDSVMETAARAARGELSSEERDAAIADIINVRAFLFNLDGMTPNNVLGAVQDSNLDERMKRVATDLLSTTEDMETFLAVADHVLETVELAIAGESDADASAAINELRTLARAFDNDNLLTPLDTPQAAPSATGSVPARYTDEGATEELIDLYEAYEEVLADKEVVSDYVTFSTDLESFMDVTNVTGREASQLALILKRWNGPGPIFQKDADGRRRLHPRISEVDIAHPVIANLFDVEALEDAIAEQGSSREVTATSDTALTGGSSANYGIVREQVTREEADDLRKNRARERKAKRERAKKRKAVEQAADDNTPQEEGPQDGDTKVENGKTYIFKDGRWRLADNGEAAEAKATSPEIDSGGFMAAQEDRGVQRFSSEEISRQARVTQQAQNEQEGLGMVVPQTIGGMLQTDMFAGGDDSPAASTSQAASEPEAPEPTPAPTTSEDMQAALEQDPEYQALKQQVADMGNVDLTARPEMRDSIAYLARDAERGKINSLQEALDKAKSAARQEIDYLERAKAVIDRNVNYTLENFDRSAYKEEKRNIRETIKELKAVGLNDEAKKLKGVFNEVIDEVLGALQKAAGEIDTEDTYIISQYLPAVPLKGVEEPVSNLPERTLKRIQSHVSNRLEYITSKAGAKALEAKHQQTIANPTPIIRPNEPEVAAEFTNNPLAQTFLSDILQTIDRSDEDSIKTATGLAAYVAYDMAQYSLASKDERKAIEADLKERLDEYVRAKYFKSSGLSPLDFERDQDEKGNILTKGQVRSLMSKFKKKAKNPDIPRQINERIQASIPEGVDFDNRARTPLHRERQASDREMVRAMARARIQRDPMKAENEGVFGDLGINHDMADEILNGDMGIPQPLLDAAQNWYSNTAINKPRPKVGEVSGAPVYRQYKNDLNPTETNYWFSFNERSSDDSDGEGDNALGFDVRTLGTGYIDPFTQEGGTPRPDSEDFFDENNNFDADGYNAAYDKFERDDDQAKLKAIRKAIKKGIITPPDSDPVSLAIADAARTLRETGEPQTLSTIKDNTGATISTDDVIAVPQPDGDGVMMLQVNNGTLSYDDAGNIQSTVSATPIDNRGMRTGAAEELNVDDVIPMPQSANEGDTKVIAGVTYILKDGYWRRLNPDDESEDPVTRAEDLQAAVEAAEDVGDSETAAALEDARKDAVEAALANGERPIVKQWSDDTPFVATVDTYNGQEGFRVSGGAFEEHPEVPGARRVDEGEGFGASYFIPYGSLNALELALGHEVMPADESAAGIMSDALEGIYPIPEPEPMPTTIKDLVNEFNKDPASIKKRVGPLFTATERIRDNAVRTQFDKDTRDAIRGIAKDVLIEAFDAGYDKTRTLELMTERADEYMRTRTLEAINIAQAEEAEAAQYPETAEALLSDYINDERSSEIITTVGNLIDDAYSADEARKIKKDVNEQARRVVASVFRDGAKRNESISTITDRLQPVFNDLVERAQNKLREGVQKRISGDTPKTFDVNGKLSPLPDTTLGLIKALTSNASISDAIIKPLRAAINAAYDTNEVSAIQADVQDEIENIASVVLSEAQAQGLTQEEAVEMLYNRALSLLETAKAKAEKKAGQSFPTQPLKAGALEGQYEMPREMEVVTPKNARVKLDSLIDSVTSDENRRFDNRYDDITVRRLTESLSDDEKNILNAAARYYLSTNQVKDKRASHVLSAVTGVVYGEDKNPTLRQEVTDALYQNDYPEVFERAKESGLSQELKTTRRDIERHEKRRASQDAEFVLTRHYANPDGSITTFEQFDQGGFPSPEDERKGKPILEAERNNRPKPSPSEQEAAKRDEFMRQAKIYNRLRRDEIDKISVGDRINFWPDKHYSTVVEVSEDKKKMRVLDEKTGETKEQYAHNARLYTEADVEQRVKDGKPMRAFDYATGEYIIQTLDEYLGKTPSNAGGNPETSQSEQPTSQQSVSPESKPITQREQRVMETGSALGSTTDGISPVGIDAAPGQFALYTDGASKTWAARISVYTPKSRFDLKRDNGWVNKRRDGDATTFDMSEFAEGELYEYRGNDADGNKVGGFVVNVNGQLMQLPDKASAIDFLQGSKEPVAQDAPTDDAPVTDDEVQELLDSGTLPREQRAAKRSGSSTVSNESTASTTQPEQDAQDEPVSYERPVVKRPSMDKPLIATTGQYKGQDGFMVQGVLMGGAIRGFHKFAQGGWFVPYQRLKEFESKTGYETMPKDDKAARIMDDVLKERYTQPSDNRLRDISGIAQPIKGGKYRVLYDQDNGPEIGETTTINGETYKLEGFGEPFRLNDSDAYSRWGISPDAQNTHYAYYVKVNTVSKAYTPRRRILITPIRVNPQHKA